MEEILIPLLLIGIFVFAPITLALIAMSRTRRMEARIEALSRLVDALTRKTAAGESPAAEKTPAPQPPPLAAQPAPAKPAFPPPPARLPVLPPEAFKETAAPAPEEPSMELALGGKVASFVGIGALIVGVAYFVGYAIQHQWIGPGARVVLGLLSGGLLVALGHLAETRGRNLQILARALTGGGSALFYFCVFAAYGIYHLVSAPVAAGGLVASAAAVLALAAVYDSQAVAVLGVVGAFFAPALVGGTLNEGVFPLAFVAVINVPVILLGVKRNWQLLYNLAFLQTVGLMAAWLERELPGTETRAWMIGLGFTLVYFAEFIALALVKLSRERRFSGRTADIVRLLLASLALLGALYWILTEAKLDSWVGTAFLAAALLHVAVARIAWSRLPDFKDEILALLVGGLTFASLALPAQLDGVWVSLGWAIEGVVLAWFALRVGSGLLAVGAMFLGGVGLMKSLVFDVTLYEATPRLFLNGRFVVGIVSAALLGVQGALHARAKKAANESGTLSWSEALGCAAIASLLVVVFVDVFFTMESGDPFAWLLTTFSLVAAGSATLILTRERHGSAIRALGYLLLLAVPVKILLFDLGFGWHHYHLQCPVFRNVIFWFQLAILVMAISVVTPRTAGAPPPASVAPNYAVTLNVFSLLAGIVIVTLEIHRGHSPWTDSLVTLWWAVCALAMAVTGLVRRRAYLRYFALLVFGATVVKVFLVDLSMLRGLQRVAAFMGVGLLLLVLSYIYQRVAPVLMGERRKGTADS